MGLYRSKKRDYNRLNSYDLPTEEYNREEQVIHNILVNNSFPSRQQKKKPPSKLKKQTETRSAEDKKWVTFTYIGKETTFITNVLNGQTSK